SPPRPDERFSLSLFRLAPYPILRFGECGGKRSATPLWLMFESISKQTSLSTQSGVALRLPSQSRSRRKCSIPRPISPFAALRLCVFALKFLAQRIGSNGSCAAL